MSSASPQAAPLTLNCTAVIQLHCPRVHFSLAKCCYELMMRWTANTRWCAAQEVLHCVVLGCTLNCTAQRHVVMRPRHRHKQYSCWGVKCPNTPSLHKYKNMKYFFIQVGAGGYPEDILQVILNCVSSLSLDRRVYVMRVYDYWGSVSMCSLSLYNRSPSSSFTAFLCVRLLSVRVSR